MKLNFWQMIGLVLLVIGIALYIWKHTNKPATTQRSEVVHSLVL